MTYTTFALDSGANAKEAQSLARHSTPNLTMNVYARARDERLASLAESIGEIVAPTVIEQKIAVGAENDGQRIKVAEATNVNIANTVAGEIKQGRVSNSNPFTRSLVPREKFLGHNSPNNHLTQTSYTRAEISSTNEGSPCNTQGD